MATTGEPKYGFENVATAAMLGHCARTFKTVARMSLRVAGSTYRLGKARPNVARPFHHSGGGCQSLPRH